MERLVVRPQAGFLNPACPSNTRGIWYVTRYVTRYDDPLEVALPTQTTVCSTICMTVFGHSTVPNLVARYTIAKFVCTTDGYLCF